MDVTRSKTICFMKRDEFLTGIMAGTFVAILSLLIVLI